MCSKTAERYYAAIWISQSINHTMMDKFRQVRDHYHQLNNPTLANALQTIINDIKRDHRAAQEKKVEGDSYGAELPHGAVLTTHDNDFGKEFMVGWIETAKRAMAEHY